MKRKAHGVLSMGRELIFDLLTMAIAVIVPTVAACIAQYLLGTTWLSVAVYIFAAWKMLGVMATLDRIFTSIANGVRDAVPPGATLKGFKVLELDAEKQTCKVNVQVEKRVDE